MATPQVKDLVLRSPAGSSEVVTFAWPLQIGHGQDKHDNGIDIIDTIKFVCDELPSISSAFEEINLNQIDTACYKTMTNLVDRFNKAVDSIVALEKGTSLPAERLNKFAHPSLLRHILQLVYNAAVLDPDKLNQYEPFSPEVYGETSYELVQQMIKHVTVSNEDTFIDLGSGVGQVVLQMAGSFPLKTCIGIEKADTPAAYAERMDTIFRQYMAWFGKRYCEYKLIKGDFLVDEHREKITSSSLVFVNNFAFGPNVDHQLKERFADLRDGARVVSSKSFCPLNFRITDRNLSDIGTIMHVSEIPPLKGSVSWTCKPVSYYLHVIDRTILERYFQRLKTKGADNDHVGSVRTTRDRAKREANNHALTHNNNNNNNNSNTAAQHRTNSPANVNSQTSGSASKTRQQQQQQQQQQAQQQQQQQRNNNIEMDTSTESDGDAGTTTNGGTTTSNGPTTRKVWSDWCSSKGKSSQSDDEENNNFSSTTNSRNARATTQKKRKKLTRKAAIASKSAAAAQREATAREREAAAITSANNSKESSSKEDNGSQMGAGRGGRKGRMKKGARGRKSLKIVGLDVLHKETLLSTSVETMCKKLPAAPGTVDQRLTSLLTDDMSHTELDIPESPQDTPYALQILLDVFRSQYMALIDQMKSKTMVPQITKQIKQEQERKARLKNRASQLDKQIKVLIDDSVALLKVRMNELGINVSSPNDLIAKAKEIVGRHKDLQNAVSKIRNEVTVYESEQKHLVKQRSAELHAPLKLYGANGKVKLEMPYDLSESAAQELVIKEIANTLAQRKRMYAQVSSIEKETTTIEKAVEEQRTAAQLLAQGTNMTLAPMSTISNGSSLQTANLPGVGPTAQAMQLMTTSASVGATVMHNSVTPATSAVNLNALNTNPMNSTVPNNLVVSTSTSSKLSSAHAKNSRRNREHRARSQEWPEVPDVGKIEESNPEVLAQKILETGRQIEAGKFTTGTAYANGKHVAQEDKKRLATTASHNNNNNNKQQQRNEQIPSVSIYMNPTQDSTLMPAPTASNNNKQQLNSVMQITANTLRGTSILPKCELPGMPGRKHTLNASIQETPKVANFEDRLKSIITSALNEDQEHRKATVHATPGPHVSADNTPTPSPQQSPAPKRSKQHANAAAAAATAVNLVTTNHLPPPPTSGHAQIPGSVQNMITVATQGLVHLNANTTISPITPPLPANIAVPNVPPNNINGGLPYGTSSYTSGKYGKQSSNVGANAVNSSLINNQANAQNVSAQKYASAVSASKETASNLSTSVASKYQQHNHQVHPTPPPVTPPQVSQSTQHMAHLTTAALYAASNASAAADLVFHRRRSSVSANSYEHFIAQQQQQQQQHALMMAAAAHVAQQQQQQQQQQQHPHGQVATHAHQHPHHQLTNAANALHPLEFKAPSLAENLMTSAQRSGSREQLDDLLPRSSSANSDSAIMHYPTTRDRLPTHERSISRESALSQPLPLHQNANLLIRPPSRPSSNSSQPDYTQVSPAKMALRRHLSQEKLNQQPLPTPPPSGAPPLPMSTKTIGDLVNGEIERTLEISHQSIINAAVNMSTMGSASGSNGAVSIGGHNANTHFMERALLAERERDRSHERLLINPNAQRPERVHVRMPAEEQQHVPSAAYGGQAGNGVEISPRSGRKSPFTNNLATLAHVAYNQKSVAGSETAISMKVNAPPTSASAPPPPRNYVNSNNSRHESNSVQAYQHLPVAHSSRAGNGVGRGGRDYQTVALPRAEMKGCIEAYFHEEQQHQQQQQQQQQQHQAPLTNQQQQKGKERSSGSSSRGARMNGANPPLEGLAASLQDHVMARKYKEENEERQRRAAAAATAASNNHQQMPNHYGNHITSAAHYQSTNGTPHKLEIGIKRTSPLATHQPRPAKLPHYSHEPMLQQQQQQPHNPYANTNGGLHHHHQHHHNSVPPTHPMSPSPTPSSSSSSGSRRSKQLPLEPLLMSPEINSIMSDERPLQLSTSLSMSATSTSSSVRQHHNHHNHQQQQQQHQQHLSHHRQQINTTPTLMVGRGSATSNSSAAAAAADDDDVIAADDESHWQHRVSSGFDRLVAFASTELDKTRRSIDTDTVPSSISCNTSPDSGITHSSSNSDAARTFLSTSSTSSQMDLPISSGGSSSSSGIYSHHNSLSQHTSHATDHLSDSSMRSSHSDATSLHASASLKTTSPVDPSAIESPPLSDIGLPRTPSPSAAVATPPLATAPVGNEAAANNNTAATLKIPLKYQRKSKSSSEKHYKKKFCERNWEYDCDELLAYSNSAPSLAADAAGTANGPASGVGDNSADVLNDEDTSAPPQCLKSTSKSPKDYGVNTNALTMSAATSLATTSSTPLTSTTTTSTNHHHHKSSKFRPKGKDWDWSLDSNSNKSRSETVASVSAGSNTATTSN